MTRFYGVVGYGESVETPSGSGVWKNVITEHPYYGDEVRNIRRLQEGESVNKDIAVTNSISIVADEYANQHFHKIKYVEWNGVRWTVQTVEVRRPRLILNLGEVYNGPTP